MCGGCADLETHPGGPSVSERVDWPHDPVGLVEWFYDVGSEPPEAVVRAAIGKEGDKMDGMKQYVVAGIEEPGEEPEFLHDDGTFGPLKTADAMPYHYAAVMVKMLRQTPLGSRETYAVWEKQRAREIVLASEVASGNKTCQNPHTRAYMPKVMLLGACSVYRCVECGFLLGKGLGVSATAAGCHGLDEKQEGE